MLPFRPSDDRLATGYTSTLGLPWRLPLPPEVSLYRAVAMSNRGGRETSSKFVYDEATKRPHSVLGDRAHKGSIGNTDVVRKDRLRNLHVLVLCEEWNSGRTAFQQHRAVRSAPNHGWACG
jgi:hypothetical protein